MIDKPWEQGLHLDNLSLAISLLYIVFHLHILTAYPTKENLSIKLEQSFKKPVKKKALIKFAFYF